MFFSNILTHIFIIIIIISLQLLAVRVDLLRLQQTSDTVGGGIAFFFWFLALFICVASEKYK